MSVFQRDIRPYVGRRSSIRVKAAVLVENESSEVLLLKRPGSGEWGLPSGNVKPGEALEDTAARELWEESGLVAENMRLLDLISGPRYVKKHPGGDEEYFVIGLYVADGIRSEINLPPGKDNEVSLKYFGLEELPKLDPLTAHLLEKIRQ